MVKIAPSFVVASCNGPKNTHNDSSRSVSRLPSCLYVCDNNNNGLQLSCFDDDDKMDNICKDN